MAPLEDFRRLRLQYDANIHDVVLAVVTGGLRAWLQMRGEPVTGRSTVRALVPVSVNEHGVDEHGDEPPSPPSWSSFRSGSRHRSCGCTRWPTPCEPAWRTVERSAPSGSPGWPGSRRRRLHAAGARLAAGLSHRVFNLLVTNAPGPQQPRYLAGARLLEAYPVSPLSKGQALSIGVTSYDGQMFVGLFGDRDAMPDLDVLGQCLHDALDELLETLTL